MKQIPEEKKEAVINSVVKAVKLHWTTAEEFLADDQRWYNIESWVRGFFQQQYYVPKRIREGYVKDLLEEHLTEALFVKHLSEKINPDFDDDTAEL